MEEFDDNEINELEHNRLISAVSKLDKTQHIKVPTRSEPTNLQSEFNLIKTSNKLDISKVVKVLENTANHVAIGKKLKKSHDASKVLRKPVEKPQAERIKRSTGYEQTIKKIGRWDPVVARSRTMDYVSYPIKHVSHKMQQTSEFLSKLKLKSPLELELDEVDPPAPVVEEEKEEPVYPMSYEEMVEQRQHLAKMRAQQSFKAAKAKRQSKIKSKKYHRVLKKEKLKQQLKEFEELQKTDPEEALKRLESLEKSRALERHTLRHKNTGKWAKNKMVRAKYDKDVRQELAEQLAVSRSLTAKTQQVDSTDDEADDVTAIPDLTLSQDPTNPWMTQASGKTKTDAEFDFGYKKYLDNKLFRNKAVDSESDEETPDSGKNNENVSVKNAVDEFVDNVNDDDDNVEAEVVNEPADNVEGEVVNKPSETQKAKLVKIKSRNKMLKQEIPNKTDESQKVEAVKIKSINKTLKQKTPNKSEESQKVEAVKIKPMKKIIKKKARNVTATSSWEIEEISSNKEDAKETRDISKDFDSLESKMKEKVQMKLNMIKNQIKLIDKNLKISKSEKKRVSGEIDSLEYLSFKNKKTKAIIDERLIETTSRAPDSQTVRNETSATSDNVKLVDNVKNERNEENTAQTNIDPTRFIQAKPKYLNTALPGSENLDQMDDDDEQVVPKVNIEEVFEEDDVVASFRQEKEEEAKKNQPEEIDLSLPGWGSWGGKGIKAPKRKKNRFIMKDPPKVPRRDDNKGDIIIKEFKEPKLATHKVSEVPFPFNSVREYEASIRAPLGNTFIPEKAHKLLIRPSVITKAGTIIEPMDEEELLLEKNRTFKNENIIKLFGKR